MASFAKRMYTCARAPTHTHTHTRARAATVEGSHRDVRVRRYAPSSRFRFRQRDRNAYIPPRRREKEKGAARPEGSTLGIGSIARTRTCALARATDTCVHTRPPLRRVRAAVVAAAAALASIKAVRCLPRRGRRDSNLLGPPSFLPSACPFPRYLHPAPSLPSRHLVRRLAPLPSMLAATRGYLSQCVTPLVIANFRAQSRSRTESILFACHGTETFALYPESTSPIEFRSPASNFAIHAPGCCLWGFPMNIA